MLVKHVIFFLCLWATVIMSKRVRCEAEFLENDVRMMTQELVGRPEDDIHKYEVEKVAIGTINYCFIVTTPHSKVVARISRDANEDNSLSDRTKERNLLRIISERGVGMRLLGVFENGHITQHVDGAHLTVSQMPELWKGTSKLIAELHRVSLTDEEKVEFDVSVWDRMDNWLQRADGQLRKEDLEFFTKEIGELQEILNTSEYNDKCMFHGDVNHGNVIRNKKTGDLTLVDYEFSGYGERLFDLANHFCEWSGLDLDWNLYPSPSQQYQFLENYALHSFGPEYTACEVEQLQKKVEKYQLVSHMFWGLWGKLMAAQRPDDPFYEPYSMKRVARYLEVKDRVLADHPVHCIFHQDL